MYSHTKANRHSPHGRLGAITFFGRERLAEQLPNALAMRLFVSAGGTLLLMIVVFDYIAARAGKKRRDRPNN